jgi:hypothetical protein
MYTRTVQRIMPANSPQRRAVSGLGDVTSDPSTTGLDLSSLFGSPSASLDLTSTYVPVAPVSSSDGNQPASSGGLSDFLNALTGAAKTATAIYSAADLIQINQQRAAQGLLPVNQYGQVGSTVGTQRTTAATLGGSGLWLLLGAGVLLVVLAKR